MSKLSNGKAVEAVIDNAPPLVMTRSPHTTLARAVFPSVPSMAKIEGEKAYHYQQAMLEVTMYDDELEKGVDMALLWEEAHQTLNLALRLWDLLRVLATQVTGSDDPLPDWESDPEIMALVEKAQQYEQLEQTLLEPRPNGETRIRIWCIYGFDLPGGGNWNLMVTEDTKVIPTLHQQLYGINQYKWMCQYTGTKFARQVEEPPLPQPLTASNIIEAKYHEEVQDAPPGTIIKFPVSKVQRYITDKGDYWSFYCKTIGGNLPSGRSKTAQINLASAKKDSATYEQMHAAFNAGILDEGMESEEIKSKKEPFCVITVRKRQAKTRAGELFTVFDLLKIEPVEKG